jgi:hypothetical protein
MVAVLTTRWMGRMLQRKAVNDNVMELQETVKIKMDTIRNAPDVQRVIFGTAKM